MSAYSQADLDTITATLHGMPYGASIHPTPQRGWTPSRIVEWLAELSKTLGRSDSDRESESLELADLRRQRNAVREYLGVSDIVRRVDAGNGVH